MLFAQVSDGLPFANALNLIAYSYGGVSINHSEQSCGPQEPTLCGKSSYHEPTGPSFDSLGLGVDVSMFRLHVFWFRGRGLGCTWDSALAPIETVALLLCAGLMFAFWRGIQLMESTRACQVVYKRIVEICWHVSIFVWILRGFDRGMGCDDKVMGLRV